MVVVHIPTTGTSVWHLYLSCCRDTPEPSQYSFIIYRICHSCLAILSPNFTSPKYWTSSVYYLTICLKYCQMQTPRCLVWVYTLFLWPVCQNAKKQRGIKRNKRLLLERTHTWTKIGFLFLLGSGKGCILWLWHSLDFSLTFFFIKSIHTKKSSLLHTPLVPA